MKYIDQCIKHNKNACTVILEPRDQLDKAIVGVVLGEDGLKHLKYSYRKLILAFMEDMSEEDAAEWVAYNTVRAIPYMGGPGMAAPV